MRTLAEAHTHSACAKENCLLCEAGFLFRMLGDAKGTNCQASNFSRAFGSSPQVVALGLMDHDGEATVAYASLIQTFNRYLLDQMTAEADAPGAKPSLIKSTPHPTPKSPLAQLLRVEAKTVSVCQQCGVATTRDNALSVIDLVYPRRAMSNELPPASDYASILRNSIHRETVARMVCPACRQANHLRIRRVLADAPLPPVLVINAGVRTSDELEIWLDGRQNPGSRFIQPAFAIARQGDAVVVTSQPDLVVKNGETVYALQVRSRLSQRLKRVAADTTGPSSGHGGSDPVRGRSTPSRGAGQGCASLSLGPFVT